MIVPMAKTFIVARRADREDLLAALRRLGVLHVEPVDPGRAAPDADTTEALDRMRRAIQILETTEPEGAAPDLSAVGATDEVLRIQRAGAERMNRLATLHRQIERLAHWGDVTTDQLQDLREAGLEPQVFAAPADAVGDFQAECVEVLGPWEGKRVLVAALQRDGEPEVPEGAEPVPAPPRDRPSLRAEAQEIDAALKKDNERLRRLANLVDAMHKERARLQAKAEWTATARSALEDERLYALQGWVPAEEVESLAGRIADEGVEAAVQAIAPDEDEEPPTLIRYPRWAKPIQGLFEFLGTVPGYREFDVAGAFMVALPLFSAIIISDLGYGLLYLVPMLVFYRQVSRTLGARLAQLIAFVGVCSIVWGLLIASFFGVDFSGHMAQVPVIGPYYGDGPLIEVSMERQSALQFLMWLSVTLGAIQLSLAHLWRAAALFPNQQCLSELGWAAFLWGMWGAIKWLLINTAPPSLDNAYGWLLVGGGALVLLFTEPSWNPARRLGLGVLKSLLPAISTFGDTISYIRLMVLGLASTALALAFNNLAGQVPLAAAIPILMIGHGLNVALSVVSLLAHGVRLNVLEFSNNLGMTWSGYPYEPFSATRSEEA
ncbi:MAG: hypothetical protein R6X20_15530 [Phycisphaerae bacterium]